MEEPFSGLREGGALGDVFNFHEAKHELVIVCHSGKALKCIQGRTGKSPEKRASFLLGKPGERHSDYLDYRESRIPRVQGAKQGDAISPAHLNPREGGALGDVFNFHEEKHKLVIVCHSGKAVKCIQGRTRKAPEKRASFLLGNPVNSTATIWITGKAEYRGFRERNRVTQEARRI